MGKKTTITQNYAVIGGQYQSYCFGCTPTLLGAKRLARKNIELWDNWQGWHAPAIYRFTETELKEGDPEWKRHPKVWGHGCSADPIAIGKCRGGEFKGSQKIEWIEGDDLELYRW